MLHRLASAVALLLLLALSSTSAHSQGPMGLCTYNTLNPSAGCVPVTSNTPLPTTGVTGDADFALSQTVCGSAASSCVIRAAPANFYGVYANCTSACWVMVFNRTTAPTNGATTAGTASGNVSDCFEVAAGSSKSLFYLLPIAYSVGVTVAISSTACATLTLSTVGFIKGVYK